VQARQDRASGIFHPAQRPGKPGHALRVEAVAGSSAAGRRARSAVPAQWYALAHPTGKRAYERTPAIDEDRLPRAEFRRASRVIDSQQSRKQQKFSSAVSSS